MFRAILNDPCCLALLVAAGIAFSWKAGGLLICLARKKEAPRRAAKGKEELL